MKILTSVFCVFLVLFARSVGLSAANPVPLPNAHAHNDYEHTRPLLDALDNGFCSVEADVHLFEGQLLVAHDAKDLMPERTLQALYLDPLLERARQNQGRIFPGGPEFTLLIDIKTDGQETYRALSQILPNYQEMLTGTHASGKVIRRVVSVVISGNRAIGLIAADYPRLAGIDGRLEDLETMGTAKSMSTELMPLISDRWSAHFQWTGEGLFPAAEKKKLTYLVEKVHQSGRRIRFWATPDKKAVWRELQDAGVDLINTDDLSGLADFLRSWSQP